jgi:exosome complex exonuclease DIS3/RRP44
MRQLFVLFSRPVRSVSSRKKENNARLSFAALLSSNLCSLRGGEERYAFSAIWEVTPGGDFLRSECFKSVIK